MCQHCYLRIAGLRLLGVVVVVVVVVVVLVVVLVLGTKFKKSYLTASNQLFA